MRLFCHFATCRNLCGNHGMKRMGGKGNRESNKKPTRHQCFLTRKMSLRTRTIPIQSVLQPDSNYGDVTIGRASAQARSGRVASSTNLFLTDRTVSKKHAIIEVSRKQGEIVLSLMDTDSHHGTVIRDTLLSPGRWVRVEKGDLIGLVSVSKEKYDDCELFSDKETPPITTESCKFLVRYEGCEDDNIVFTVLSKEEVASLRGKKKNSESIVLLLSDDDDDDYVLEDYYERPASVSMSASASSSVPPFDEEREEDNSSLFGEEHDHDTASISIDVGPQTIVFDDEEEDRDEPEIYESDVDVVLFDDEDGDCSEVVPTKTAVSVSPVLELDDDNEVDNEDDSNFKFSSSISVSAESVDISPKADSSCCSASLDEEEVPKTPTEETKSTESDSAPVFKTCSLETMLNEVEMAHWSGLKSVDESLYPPIKFMKRSKSTDLSQDTTCCHTGLIDETPATTSKVLKAHLGKIAKVKSAKKNKKTGVKKEILTGLFGFAVGMTMGAGLTFSSLASLGKSMGA